MRKGRCCLTGNPHAAQRLALRALNKIVIDKDLWITSGVTELIFEQGVALPSDSDRIFENLGISSIDLSAVDVTAAESMNDMFRGCTSLNEIKTPVNVTLDATLSAAYADENGNSYSYLPKNLTESVTLSRATQSEWLNDYEYHIEGNKIVLTAYHGESYDVTVHGSAEVAGTTYSLVEYTAGIDASPFGGTLTLEQGVVLPDDCRNLFANAWDLQRIDLSNIDTSNVTNMYGMFDGCYGLTELDLSGFDTSNVTDMGYMFSGCESLSSLDLSSFDTSNVTAMNNMFSYCNSLNEIKISGFDTSNVTTMYDMFGYCHSLTEIDVSGFDTSNCIDMSYMFSSCGELTSLDVSGFDTSNVARMNSMFRGC